MDINRVRARREKIIITKVETKRISGGGTEAVESVYWETWAEVNQQKASRVMDNFQDALKMVYSVVFRSRSDKHVNSSMLVSIRGKVMAIQSINNIGFKDKYIELVVTHD